MKTTFQDELSFRCDMFGGDLLVKITRALALTHKLFPNISNDQQSNAWVWRGSGVQGDPYSWVKVNATDIVIWTGFYTGAENWSKFRSDVRDALLEGLSGIETDFIANLTTTYGWVVPTSELGKLKELKKFSHLTISEDLEQPERFSTLFFNPTTKQRVLFEGGPEASGDESRLSLSVQTNQIETSLAKAFEAHFTSSDTAYVKANSFVEELFGK